MYNTTQPPIYAQWDGEQTEVPPITNNKVPVGIVFNSAKPFPADALEKIHKYCIESGDRLVLTTMSHPTFWSLIDPEKKCASKNPNHPISCYDPSCVATRHIAYERSYKYWNWEQNKWVLEKAPDEFCSNATMKQLNTNVNHTCSATAKCTRCNNYVPDALSKFIGTKYCYSCVSGIFIACIICGDRAAPRQMALYTLPGLAENYMCKKCSGEYLERCTSCKRWAWAMDIDDDGCGYCEANVIQEYHFKPHPAFFHGTSSDLVPADPGRIYFGLELEVEMKDPYVGLKNKVARRFYKDVTSNGQVPVYLKKDGTICNGFEIVSHPGDFDWWHRQDNKLLRGIRRLTKTCESYGSENCGLHLHVSRAAFSNFALAKFIAFLCDNQLFASFVAERYQKNQAPFNYMMGARPVQTARGELEHDRHTAINLNNKNTIEIRIFKGNMKTNRILKNIEFLHALHGFVHTNDTGSPKPGETHEQSIERVRSLLTVANFKKYVESNKIYYPNLNEFIKNYKRSS